MQKNQQTINSGAAGRPAAAVFRRAWRSMGALRRAGIFACAALSLALALPLSATEQRGIVRFNGLPVPGASVTATSGDKKLTAVTDSDGIYDFPNLTDGIWTIEVDMLTFEPIKREIAVSPEAPGPVWDLKMQSFDAIKTTAAPPEPKSTAPAGAGAAASPSTTPSIAAANASASATPPKSNGKGKKGASAPPTAAQTGFQRASVNAAPGSTAPAEAATTTNEASTAAPTNDMLINGSVNNGASSPFAQNPAFGNARRGGRSLYNGNLSTILDSSYLDAQNYSLTGQNTAKLPYLQWNETLSFGGPMKIPHVTFKSPPAFYLNYQYGHNHQNNLAPGLMPTDAERAGDFSAIGSTIYDPTTGQPFAGNRIPQNRLSPQALSLLSYYPEPNFVGSIYNYQVPLVNVNSTNIFQARVNKTLTPRWNANGLYAFQSQNSQNPNLFNFVDGQHSFGQRVNANASHRIGTRMFLNLGGQFSRQSLVATPFFANKTNVSGDAGIQGNYQAPEFWGPPALGFSQGLASLSDGNYRATRYQQYATTANLNWSHSPHNFQFEAGLSRQQYNMLTQSNPRGNFQFNGGATGLSSNGSVAPGTGSDFADFLLGVPDTVGVSFGNVDKYFRDWNAHVYANDDWRVSPGLTVNIGIRWDYNSPLVEKYNRLSNLDFGPNYSSLQPVLATNPVGPISGMSYPRSLVNPDKHEFSPSAAIAWRPFPASSFLVRAGYSLKYNTSNYVGIATSMAGQAPFARSLSATNTPSNPLNLATAFLAPPNISVYGYGIDPNFRIGYAQSWNVTLQRDLPGALQMTATYLGVKGTRAQQGFYPNTYPAGTVVNPCPSCPSGFEVETSNGNSHRESGQIQLRRRLRSGLTASASYTYSKSIDDAALGGGVTGLIAQNWLDLSAERGLSTFDQRHLLNLTAQYSTGVGVAGGTLLGGWRGAIVKDWTIVTNITVGSGLPLTPTCATCIPVGLASATGQRPEYVGGLDIYAAPEGRALNPAAYISNLPGQWGDAGRDSITGPGQFSLNASGARTFRISDRYSADLRFDSTNSLNHVVYGSYNVQVQRPDTPIQNQQFGFPISPNGMRRFSVRLTLRF